VRAPVWARTQDLCFAFDNTMLSYVYIMTNRSKTLYTGVTSDIEHRVWQHKNHIREGFTSRYNIDRLVYFERFSTIDNAIHREKQIKNMHRIDKMKLIVSMNPEWKDLSAEWFVRHRYAPEPKKA
jgi:putative endonuclease